MLTVVPILVPRSPGAEAGVCGLVLAGGCLLAGGCVPLSGSPLLLPPGGRAGAGDVVPLGVQLVRALAAVHHSRQLRKVNRVGFRIILTIPYNLCVGVPIPLSIFTLFFLGVPTQKT